ncbi:NAD(P)-dependent oxidoreductase [Myxococcota bacterium]|nr:NAD(P)-dependent oxidoreductase [Myxococcota bacterium]
MAQCLRTAGHTVRVWNRTAEKAVALVNAGCTLAASPREAAETADVAISMVADDEASRAIWQGPTGLLAGMQPGAFAIECSTLSHAWVLELSRQAHEKGLVYLDCPVTGLPDAAEKGALTLLVGGRDDDIDRAHEFLHPLSRQVVRFGPVGSGTAYKLIVNLLGSVEIAATAEAMETARRAGLDLSRVAEAIASGPAGSFHVGRHARIMAAESHAENLAFTTNLRRKDTRYGVELSRDLGVSSPLGALTLKQFNRTSELGFGNQNESHVLDAVRDQSRR